MPTLNHKQAYAAQVLTPDGSHDSVMHVIVDNIGTVLEFSGATAIHWSKSAARKISAAPNWEVEVERIKTAVEEHHRSTPGGTLAVTSDGSWSYNRSTSTTSTFTAKCPCGNTFPWTEAETYTDGLPECPSCGRRVSHCNTQTGEIYSWSTVAEMDAANWHDAQMFGVDGGF